MNPYWSDIPTFIEQISFQEEMELAPKFNCFEESGTLHPLQISILDLERPLLELLCHIDDQAMSPNY